MFPFLKTLIQVKPSLFLPGSKVEITNEWKHWIEMFMQELTGYPNVLYS